MSVLKDRVPQAASNRVVEVDKNTTKALLNITNLKTVSPRRHKSASRYVFTSCVGIIIAVGI